MTDFYVYYFHRSGTDGGKALSRRRATMEAIKRFGEPVMESQLVVDHTEVDQDGFVIGNVDNEQFPTDAIWGQIRSLERRALSRDKEALELVDDPQAAYMLSLESRELRKQAQTLHELRVNWAVGENRELTDTQIQYLGSSRHA